MWLVWILGIMCALVVLLEWLTNRRERARLFWKIPGPSGTLFFGNCLQVVTTPEKKVGNYEQRKCFSASEAGHFLSVDSVSWVYMIEVQLFRNLRAWSGTYKDMYRQWIFPYGVTHIYNPHDIETIISSSKFNEKSLLYETIRPWLSDGLLLSKGDKWQIRRKILTPAFHFTILQQFTSLMEENSWQLAKKLKDEVARNQTNIIPLLSDSTLNSICETAMGTKLHENASGASYKRAIHEIGQLIIYRLARSWLIFDFIFSRTEAGRRQKEVLKVIHNFPKRIIEDRRYYIETHGFKVPTDQLSKDGTVSPVKRRMAMLDLLLSAEKDGLINEEGIHEEVATFMFEGHDTTALGLTYATMELANNKDIQEKVVQELKDIFGDSRRPATMQDLNKMKYLEYCIKETMRLYPPVPVISRNITDSVTLSGHPIPPGRPLCHIHIFDLHRRGDIYKDPLKFNPERFFPENCVDRHPYAYIPFSGGPRNCIGQRFAMLEMKSVLSAMCREFEILPVTKPSELEFSADLVLRTTHPIYVKFAKRII